MHFFLSHGLYSMNVVLHSIWFSRICRKSFFLLFRTQLHYIIFKGTVSWKIWLLGYIVAALDLNNELLTDLKFFGDILNCRSLDVKSVGFASTRMPFWCALQSVSIQQYTLHHFRHGKHSVCGLPTSGATA